MNEQQLKRILQEVIRNELSTLTKNVVPETMTQELVAEKLGVETSTLAVWRSTGKGPHFIKSGSKVMYLAADINDFIEKNRVKP